MPLAPSGCGSCWSLLLLLVPFICLLPVVAILTMEDWFSSKERDATTHHQEVL